MDHVQAPASLRDRQITPEEESLTLGIDRYKKERRRQDEADTGPGRRLIKDSISPVAAAIDTFVAEARNEKPGKEHSAEKFPSSELAICSPPRNCVRLLELKITTERKGLTTRAHPNVASL